MTHGPYFDRVPVAAALKLTNTPRRTAAGYIADGLIPPPHKVPVPKGRGMMGIWEGWVVERLGKIQAMRQLGRSLEEIRHVLWGEGFNDLGDAIQSAERVYYSWVHQQYDAAGRPIHGPHDPNVRSGYWAGDKSLVSHYRDRLISMLTDQLLPEDAARRIAEQATTHRHLVATLAQLFMGIPPVLLWDGSRIVVAPENTAMAALQLMPVAYPEVDYPPEEQHRFYPQAAVVIAVMSALWPVWAMWDRVPTNQGPKTMPEAEFRPTMKVQRNGMEYDARLIGASLPGWLTLHIDPETARGISLLSGTDWSTSSAVKELSSASPRSRKRGTTAKRPRKSRRRITKKATRG